MNTAAHIAQTHINLFGNTKFIRACQLAPPTLERLEKIGQMLYWNQNKIDTCNGYLDHKNPISPLLNLDKIRKSLLFNHRVRIRLIEMWNKELQSLRM